jgi:hypothetical protein
VHILNYVYIDIAQYAFSVFYPNTNTAMIYKFPKKSDTLDQSGMLKFLTPDQLRCIPVLADNRMVSKKPITGSDI